MKNKEKYADLIKTISNPCSIEEYYLGENCEEYEGCKGCFGRFLKWLDEEAKPEKKKFSSNELVIMKSISINYNFIARDCDGDLYVYNSMPSKDNNHCVWCGSANLGFYMFNSLFNLINWDDDEPVKIDDYVERKRKNEN